MQHPLFASRFFPPCDSGVQPCARVVQENALEERSLLLITHLSYVRCGLFWRIKAIPARFSNADALGEDGLGGECMHRDRPSQPHGTTAEIRGWACGGGRVRQGG
jgi:hypothetical protein